MAQARTHARKKKTPKRVPALPDLEHAKSAVLSSLTSRSGQRNLRLAAVRRVAYEAADAGILSPELTAGIRRVKGVRRAVGAHAGVNSAA